jgi:hypothetical protein
MHQHPDPDLFEDEQMGCQCSCEGSVGGLVIRHSSLVDRWFVAYGNLGF